MFLLVWAGCETLEPELVLNQEVPDEAIEDALRLVEHVVEPGDRVMAFADQYNPDWFYYDSWWAPVWGAPPDKRNDWAVV